MTGDGLRGKPLPGAMPNKVGSLSLMATLGPDR